MIVKAFAGLVVEGHSDARRVWLGRFRKLAERGVKLRQGVGEGITHLHAVDGVSAHHGGDLRERSAAVLQLSQVDDRGHEPGWVHRARLAVVVSPDRAWDDTIAAPVFQGNRSDFDSLGT